MTSELRDIAAAAWLFRTGVEHEAGLRFTRLAAEVARLDADSPVAHRLEAAAEDERRHFSLCAELARFFGATVPTDWPATLEPVAPRRLSSREALLYEVVAACCVTETESMATLTTLLSHASGQVVRTLREIARDEVRHSQLGWAHLAREREAIDVRFLGALLPDMLAGTVDGAVFEPPARPALDHEALLMHGVLPHTMKRDLFVSTMDKVVLPGFALLGVDDAPARHWLQTKLARGS